MCNLSHDFLMGLHINTSLFCFQQLFLGQRYGSRSLPASIPMAVYEAIRGALREAGVDVTLLDQWYLKDSNFQPPVYILQPIDLMLGRL